MPLYVSATALTLAPANFHEGKISKTLLTVVRHQNWSRKDTKLCPRVFTPLLQSSFFGFSQLNCLKIRFLWSSSASRPAMYKGKSTTSDPRDFWHLRHLIRVMRRHDLAKKKTMTKTQTKTKTKTMTETNTFREHLQRAILETSDIWDTWSEWWGDTTWPKKRQWQRQIQRQRQWQRQIHLENTFKERS